MRRDFFPKRDRLIEQQPFGDDLHFFQNLRQINLFQQQFNRARFDFGKIENVVNQMQQAFRGAFRFRQMVEMFRRDALFQGVQRERCIADHRVQRRAEFVAHARKKLAFMLARLFQTLI